MVLLALESAGLFEHLLKATQTSSISSVFLQFFHHPWNGLHFWDLIQPGFMFMAGVAMAYSLHKQNEEGLTWMKSFVKVLKRCGWLFFWGVLDYAVRPKGLSFELWDVLTQLSFTTLVAFLIFQWKATYQILFSIGLLLLTECMYRFMQVPGFDQAFVDQHNFGNYVDTILMNKTNDGGWVAINCIPTSVHTIVGTMVGKLFIEGKGDILKKLLLIAAACLIIGYGIDLIGITPIIKKIATSSFTVVSLGWCILGLSACYWWIDTLKHKKYLLFFKVIGMNSLFIYLFFEIVGSRWFNEYMNQISIGLLSFISDSIVINQIIASLVIFSIEWGICYYLYKKKIFFKL